MDTKKLYTITAKLNEIYKPLEMVAYYRVILDALKFDFSSGDYNPLDDKAFTSVVHKCLKKKEKFTEKFDEIVCGYHRGYLYAQSKYAKVISEMNEYVKKHYGMNLLKKALVNTGKLSYYKRNCILNERKI